MGGEAGLGGCARDEKGDKEICYKTGAGQGGVSVGGCVTHGFGLEEQNRHKHSTQRGTDARKA